MKILKGDCLELMKDIPDKSIDMILCDLPYGTTRCKWDVIIPFTLLWQQYDRIIKDHGCMALFGSEPFSSLLRISNLKEYRYDWVWKKEQGTDFLNANRKPLEAHENISIFYKKLPTYNKQYTTGKPYKACNTGYKGTECYGHFENKFKSPGTKRNPVTVIQFNRQRGLHPTQKPVDLLEYMIKTYTNEGEIVLDNCMGSGSTGIACLHTNRHFIGMEQEEKYFEIAKTRIEAESRREHGDNIH